MKLPHEQFVAHAYFRFLLLSSCKLWCDGNTLSIGTQAEKVIDQLKPLHGGKLQRIPVFFIAKRLTTQVLQLFPEAQKEQ
ncbi:hypothetical protein GUJ93_ZPchr0004g40366 [Zizania palustris]|uniref:Uncharacterized protein n=1 Tax=Zizania palustris TaxID=103762 RepID=A0A8J5VYY5_ZIZPA|nr:hypothetical protein GUJ93_ZPchr0004g40366 [Zizania palustris]